MFLVSMKKSKLKNGLTIITEERKTESVAIEVTVHAGSNNESAAERGISHFIEHMIFEGTKTRDAMKIANDIEGVGGEIGAFTSHERTCIYVNVLAKHAKKAIEVLADIILNPVFDQKSLDKERQVVLAEIKTRHDEPRFYQWQLFEKTLFLKHPSQHPIIGYKETLVKMTRDDLFRYYHKNYVASNLSIAAVGNVKGIKKILEKSFAPMKKGEPNKKIVVTEPRQTRIRTAVQKREISNSYIVLGYQTVARDHPDSYVLDVIKAIFCRHLSGRLFDEIRIKRGLAYDVGIYNNVAIDYGFFAFYVSTDNKNIKLCKKIITDEIKKLENLGEQEFVDSKNFVEGEFLLDNEDNHEWADTLGFWDYSSDSRLADQYVKKIQKVTIKDVIRVRNKYIGKNYTMTLIGQK
jgi:predicted Zn-dependent peptidase